MINDTDVLLSKMKNENKLHFLKKAKRKYLFDKYKKIVRKSVVIITLSVIICFPKQSGNIVGQWINDFFVTIYEKIIE